MTLKIIFFGSTDDSVIVLRKLHTLVIGYWSLDIACVVTQPPRPTGRKQIVTPTPVEEWAKSHDIPVLSFLSDPDKPWMYTNENQVIDSLQPFKADLIISACYGQKIPQKTISDAQCGGLNVHPSLLPRWRGADPVPWAILIGDHQTGVTVVTLSEKFDEGLIIGQKKLPILPSDTSDALRTKLFTIGAAILTESLPNYLMKHIPVTRHPSPVTKSPYARRLTRVDGYENWETIQKALMDSDEALRLERKFRAFAPWPGVWTLIPVKSQKSPPKADQALAGKVKSEEKRLKILSLHLSPTTDFLLLDTVQLEGKSPVSWSQFQTSYLPS